MADSFVSRLPSPAQLEQRCIALATLDAILCPDWESRHYSFDCHWDREAGARMGSMHGGSGDEYFVLFFADGRCAIKGFAHDSSALDARRTVPSALREVPASFAAFTSEAAFHMEHTSFAFWYEDGVWHRSEAVPRATWSVDGASELLHALLEDADAYADWAADYYEIPVETAAVTPFFANQPLTRAMAERLNAGVDLDALDTDLEEIGYAREP